MRVRSILFECTWRHDGACHFCQGAPVVRAPSAPVPEPPLRTLKRVLAAAIRETGCQQITFSGGQPTLRPDLLDLVAFARMSGTLVSLLPNGAVLEPRMASDLKRAGCGLVQVALAGLSSATHDLVGGPGGYERTLATLDAVKAAHLKLGLTFVVTRASLGDVPAFLEVAAGLGLKKVLLNRYAPAPDDDVGHLAPSLDGLRSMLAATDEAAARTGVTPAVAVPIMPCLVRPSDYPHVRLVPGCPAGTAKALYAIDPWGGVRVCGPSGTVVGNLLETSFDELASGPLVAAFRETRPALCEPCPGWSRCRGGCRAGTERAPGRWEGEDPLLKAAVAKGQVTIPPSPLERPARPA